MMIHNLLVKCYMLLLIYNDTGRYYILLSEVLLKMDKVEAMVFCT